MTTDSMTLAEQAAADPLHDGDGDAVLAGETA